MNILRGITLVLLLTGTLPLYAQEGLMQRVQRSIPTGNSRPSGDMGRSGGNRPDTISFEHRNDAKDSLTITYKWFDSLRTVFLDGRIDDFNRYFPVPFSLQYNGNTGAAGYNLLFQPFTKVGFDAGFHAYDPYKFTLEGTKFYKATKPFTQIGYQLASGKEQIIQILHTQNPRPNFNFGFDYRLLNAPGTMVTQNTNHGNYRIFSHYTGKRKRYGAQLVYIGNSLNASENGGLANDSFLTTKSADYSRRFTLPVNLGAAPISDPNPFQTSVYTGNKYKENQLFFRHYYDIGKKDSIQINDSTTEYLFYSRLRFQHTFSYQSLRYEFHDYDVNDSIYKAWYDTTLTAGDTLISRDQFNILRNDFSLLQFPDTKNLSQYILAGATLETISGKTFNRSENMHNIILHGEYRNKTRNKLWDITANGAFYLNGNNSGDYLAEASLTRFLNNKWGNVRLYFKNVNRSPSYLYSNNTSFLYAARSNFGKENITVLQASAENRLFELKAANYLITNYLYFSNYRQPAQFNRIINLLQLSAARKFKLNKRWTWYSEITLQKTDGSAPIQLPLLFTRNRIAYEGQFFKNLQLSTGIECRYYTPYKGYDYSPVMGQFVTQDSITLHNRPDISAFLHFRIKSFGAYLRMENLNSLSFQNGFGFSHFNVGAPHYLYSGMMIRFGIQWNFVN